MRNATVSEILSVYDQKFHKFPAELGKCRQDQVEYREVEICDLASEHCAEK